MTNIAHLTKLVTTDGTSQAMGVPAFTADDNVLALLIDIEALHAADILDVSPIERLARTVRSCYDPRTNTFMLRPADDGGAQFATLPDALITALDTAVCGCLALWQRARELDRIAAAPPVSFTRSA